MNLPSAYAQGVLEAQRALEYGPGPGNPYTEWDVPVSYDNFMKLTSAPQLNPFGLTGNRSAMHRLELQKPPRPTTEKNPFSNVPLRDFGIPQRFGRAPSHCGKACKKNVYRSLFRSADDALWHRSASERQFYTTPVSSVPNEQTKFAMWLYGNNQVGKSGSLYDRYGYPYTPDSLVNTGVNAASPQNAGQVDHNFGTPHFNGAFWVNNPNYNYGFGGLGDGAVPPPNLGVHPQTINPMPFFPVAPSPVPLGPRETVPAGLHVPPRVTTN